jgi:hypothetical protein
MVAPSEGVFSVDQLNSIRDAHVTWCAANSVDPDSPVGLDAVKLMMEAYQAGKRDEELVAACDHYVEERQMHVRLGTPAITSTDEINGG